VSDLVLIDGAQGEGGGQIVRSSLALSAVTGRPVRINRVRAGRERPGLMRQHLTALRAAQQICDAHITGDAIGSQSVTFEPGRVKPGEYQFAVGTAGSATLVLQTVLPPLLIATGPSRLILEGGTHNPWAPSFDFLQRSFLRLVNLMGPKVTATLERHGFYPAGGGRLIVEIDPAQGGSLTGFDLLERGTLQKRTGRVLSCNLPSHIAERELTELRRLAEWSDESLTHEPVIATGPGNVVLIELHYEHVTELFIGFGEVGVKAETVAKQAVQAMREYLVTDVPIGPHLADQWLLPLGLSVWQQPVSARPPVKFRTQNLTNHSHTHIDVLRAFLGINIATEVDAAQRVTTMTIS